ncbi:flagellar basal body-associated protein FliL [Methylobacterium sp. 4-46]|uniref:flagellar basal body-associated protein FliL n=1 Tax=unclassified Methylobacterium TaxID=2615210 RepID=UPI000152C0FD|nr:MULTISPECIES: flagellar basal body-associated protein FliL [Methylobacterium]ACA18548.1 flagellar basal body-associated protein FliL [Methylobacterium sp. 4-46]WFT77833.1 flagellar basal body-associated protein FliL [Methylobacterium nodulans]
MAKKPKKAPEGEEGEEGGGPEAKRGKTLALVAGALVVLLLAGGGYGFVKYRAGKTEEVAEAKPAITFLDVRDLVMNLTPDVGQPNVRFIKLKVALEVHDPKTAAEIQPLMPRIEDAFQVYIREMRPADFDGSIGTYRLREELLRRVNVAVYPARVDAVLFKEFVIQ